MLGVEPSTLDILDKYSTLELYFPDGKSPLEYIKETYVLVNDQSRNLTPSSDGALTGKSI